MASRRALGFGLLLVGIVTLSMGVMAHPVNTASGAAPAAPRRVGSLPIIAEHRYRMAAKVRPLLLFWIGRDNVGGARAVWRRSPDGAVGFELLIGSVPTRAPRGSNRWGYIAEEVRGSEARLLGVMKQSNEQSLEEAKSRLASEAQEGQYVFKAIHGAAAGGEASSAITTVHLTRDLTFRDLEALLELVERHGADASVRRVSLPNGTRPGFLVALAELIHRDVAANGRPAAAEVPSRATSLPYIYNGTLHELTLRESARLREARIGARDYRDVIRARFETRNRASDKATEFELLYGASGALAEIPVQAMYQPRWWLQVELFLDDANEP
ncbi:MAG: hypothetical protein HY655_05810 [Acidobacteria bacterium]|nr:hypothetical protein [Acidobacteriota bacterium]